MPAPAHACRRKWPLTAVWVEVLRFLHPRDWWCLRRLCLQSSSTVDERAITLLLNAWRMDLSGLHGGEGGLLLTDAVRSMIRCSAVGALYLTCEELRRRGKSLVPWQLGSRELFLYAAAHSDTAAPLSTILKLAPRVLDAKCTKREDTALHDAVFCKRPWNVRALLAAGCDTRATNRTGETALHLACYGNEEADVESADALVGHDPELCELGDDYGQMPRDRLWQAQGRWLRAKKRRPTAEEACVVARLCALVEPLQPRFIVDG